MCTDLRSDHATDRACQGYLYRECQRTLVSLVTCLPVFVSPRDAMPFRLLDQARRARA